MVRIIHFRGDDRFPHGSPTLRRYVLGLPPDPEIAPARRGAEIDLIQGPVESGKTLASFSKVYALMCTIPRCKDGIRRSRILIYRQTYPELWDTVIPDFLEWFPEKDYGKLSGSEPVVYDMRFADVQCQVVFMALADDSDKTLKKLRSSFFTAAYGNEGQFNSLLTFTTVTDRTGRYPHRKDCPDFDRKGRHWMDMNAPHTHDHWVLYMRGDTPIPADMPKDQAMSYRKPDDWHFYVQPAAVFEKIDEKGDLVGYELNHRAENLQNMGDEPYLPKIHGKPRDQIDRDFRNITRASKTGAPRYPAFSREKHVAKTMLRPDENLPLFLSLDGGSTPAATFFQTPGGRYMILRTIAAENRATGQFAEELVDVINMHYPFAWETGLNAWGDPALDWTSEHSTNTSVQIYRSHGIEVRLPARKDRPQTRWEIGRKILTEFPNGEPKALFCPVNALGLVNALENVQMKTVKIAGSLQVRDEIQKNQWSHPVESWEYGLWGCGEDRALIGREGRPQPQQRSGPVNAYGRASVWGPKQSGPRKRANVFAR